MVKLVEKFLAAFAMLSIVFALSPTSALPIAGVTDEISDPLIEGEEGEQAASGEDAENTEDVTIVNDVTGTAEEVIDPAPAAEETGGETPSEAEDAGGLENIVEDVSDTVVDPASSTVEETSDELIDGAKAVEDTADSVVPGDVELVDKVEETAEPVTSGEAVDGLVDTGGELVGEVEEEVYSVPIVGEAAEEVVDTAEPVVDELTDAAEPVVDDLADTAEPVVDSLLPGDEEAAAVEGGTDDLQETANGAIAEDLVEEKAAKDLQGDTGAGDILEETTNDAISKAEVIDDSIDQHLYDELKDTGSLAAATYEQKAIPNPDLTEDEKEEIIEEAANVPGLKEWSSDGWQFVSMDFIGREESGGVDWEKAVVYLHLPDGAGDPPEECFQGWSAAIEVNMETRKAENSGFPTESAHECASEVILEDPGIGEKMMQAFASVFSPQTDARPSFVIAQADDVATNKVYGNTAQLKTPSYEEAVFDHMDRYVAHLLNQKWDTSSAQHMAQIGWLMTTVEGCIDCGTGHIPENTAAIAFTDTSVFGNLEARKVPFDWKPDESLAAETVCNEEKNYLISVLYGGEVFNHNTRVSCGSADNDSKTSNSVFFENWNTVESSSWARDITGAVEAHSAHGFMNSRDQLRQWSSSTNEEQKCDGSKGPTGIISKSLSEGGAATWSDLGSVPSAC